MRSLSLSLSLFLFLWSRFIASALCLTQSVCEKDNGSAEISISVGTITSAACGGCTANVSRSNTVIIIIIIIALIGVMGCSVSGGVDVNSVDVVVGCCVGG